MASMNDISVEAHVGWRCYDIDPEQSVKNVEAFQYMADKLQPLRGGYEVFSCPHCVSPLASYGFTDF